MSTRRFARTLHEAWPQHYAWRGVVTRYRRPRHQRVASALLASAIGIGLALVLFFGLSGCAPVHMDVARNTKGQPTAYVDGYTAGCGSGYVAAGHPYARAGKNVERYLADAVYRTGWDDGFATCKGGYDSLGPVNRR